MRALSLLALAALGVVVQQGAMPMPRAFTAGTLTDRLDARLSFWWQTMEHILGIREEYDRDWLLAKYERCLSADALAHARQGEPALEPLPELDARNDPDWRAQFDAMYGHLWSPETPVVVRGLLHQDTDHFPGVKEWNMDHFRDHIYANRTVPVFTSCKNDQSVVYEPFEQFATEAYDASLQRYARCVPDYDARLAAGINPQYVASMTGKEVELAVSLAADGAETIHCAFIGGSHVHTRMHSDFGASAYFMISGRKRWVFFPPSESALLFPKAHAHNVAYNAGLDIFAPNTTQNYLHGALRGYEVTLDAGDLLFFPSFHWHAVQNLHDEDNGAPTIGIDFAVVDLLSAWRHNAPLYAGSLFNPHVLSRVAMSRLGTGSGDSIRDIFFNDYAMKK